MADDISLVVGVDYSDLTGLVKTTQQTKQALGVMAQQFAKTGDQKAYMAGINKLVQANKMLDKESRMSRSAIMKLGNTMRQEAKFAEQLAKATQRAGTAMQQTARKTNQLGVLMQQSGYQVGDFAIQVQSGTNYMVAFGQQATQLVGTFAMLAKSTRMIALFSGLGIALPILTAIGAYFIRAKDNADSANGSFEDVKQTLQELSDIDKGLGIGSDMVSNADVAITKFNSILTIMRNIQAVRLSEQLAEPLDALREEFKEFSRQVQYAAISQTEAPEFKILGFEDQSRAIQAFQILADIQGKTKEELQDSVVQQTLFLRGSGLLTEEVKKILATYGDVVGVVGAATKTQDDLNDSQKKSYKRFDAHRVAWQKHQDKIAKANTDAQQELELLIQKNVLLDLELQYGKDSSAYKRMAAGYDIDALRAKLEAKGVDEDIIQDAIIQLQLQRKITAELEKQGDVTYTMFEGSDAAKRMRKYASRGTPTGTGQPSTRSTTETAPKESAREMVAQLIKEAEHKKRLVSLTDEQARYEQLLFKMQEDNAKKRDPLNQKQLEQEAKKIHLINEQTLAFEKQKKAQEDLANTVGSSMETAMMSMVDGTKSVKDAFRDMAADIVRHLYKVLVVQQMINAFGGMLSGSSNPILKTLGGGLESYGSMDGGGYTGNGPRSGGLDGKGGFMMMMHPRETVVDHTKGQQANTNGPTIVQNFNFSANGDDSVKKIIAQAAPQIAQMTKNSMLNDRRRGGTTKAVFG